MKKFLLYLFLIISAQLKAQITFQKFVDTIDVFNAFRCGIQTFDGGYIFAGSHQLNPGGEVYFLLHTDEYGDTLWSKIYETSLLSIATSIEQTIDSGFIIGGIEYTSGTGNSQYTNVIKTDKDGNLDWVKSFGPRSKPCDFVSCKQTFEGGYIVACSIDTSQNPLLPKNEVILLKLNNSGDTLWTKIYHEMHFVYDFKITRDSGFILIGADYYSGENRILKTDLNGNFKWGKKFNISQIEISSIEETTDNGFIISLLDSLKDLQLIKTDSACNISWAKKYGNPLVQEESYCVKQTNDNGFIVVGVIYSDTINFASTVIIKTDQNGDTLWVKSYSADSGFFGTFINRSNDGGFIVGGIDYYSFPSFYSRSFIFKTDNLGNIDCAQYHPQLDVSNLNLTDTIVNFTVSSGCDTVNRPFYLRNESIYYSDICVQLLNNELSSNELVVFYPNPTSGILTIDAEKFNSDPTINIYNLLGKKVFEGLLEKGTKNVINLSTLNPGIYAAEIYNGKEHFTCKIIVE